MVVKGAAALVDAGGADHRPEPAVLQDVHEEAAALFVGYFGGVDRGDSQRSTLGAFPPF